MLTIYDVMKWKGTRIVKIDTETGKMEDITDSMDYVKVIRCKDCKHHHYDGHEMPYCDKSDYGYGWEDDDFCSYAERKEE